MKKVIAVVCFAGLLVSASGCWAGSDDNDRRMYDLNRKQQAVLKGLYKYRDQEAARRNQPLFKVFADKTCSTGEKDFHSRFPYIR